MHLPPLIQDLAIILAVAGLVAVIFQRIRQPVVLGYLFAGMLVGPAFLRRSLISDLPSIRTWADLGIVFLMFTLGLEFSFRKLSKVGISAGLTAVIETSCMAAVGFGTGRLLGWSMTDSLFLGSMLAISSTIIIVKALEELKLKTRRFAELIFAVLIVEDLIAILILVALSTIAVTRDFSGIALLLAAGKLILVVGSWFIAGYFVLPRFIQHVGRVSNIEVLSLVALGLCLSLVVFAAYFQYSIALGAFIMGSILAESTESSRIIERMEPLRDVFAAIFFVSVGMLMDPHAVVDNIGAITISLVLICCKITFVTLGALITGQTLRTSVQVGFGLGQIGEFSFIIAGLGFAMGITHSRLYPIAVAVSLITAFTTPYLIRISHAFATRLEAALPFSVQDGLNRYVTWTRDRRADRMHQHEFYRLLFKWLLNALIVTVVFILSGELLIPRLMRLNWEPILLSSAAWMAAIVISGPFLWAMLFVFKEFRISSHEQIAKGIKTPLGASLLLSRFATILLIGFVSLEFFAAIYALAITAVLATGFFTIFYRQLETSYHWFEERFISTFDDSTPKTQRMPDVMRDLAPWDAHLVRIKVHPNADLVGKTLAQTQLRNQYGVSVVVLQRGLKTIIAPKPEQEIFPKDELLVLGTDEQIDSLRPIIERPPGLEERFQSIEGYQLRNLFISPKSPLILLSIREANIREKFGAMVVGIERKGKRLINPDSDLKLEPDDLLWLVGEKERLDRLMNEFAPQS